MACCDNPNFPARVAAGVDLNAAASFPEYPASNWTLTAVLRGKSNIDITATSDGTAYKFAVPAATTSEWVPGDYWYSMRVSNGVQVIEVERGQVEIAPDLAAATGDYDGRTANEIALDAINAILANRATIDQQRYTINNRELWRTPIADLLKLQSFYKTIVRREKACANGKSTFGRRINVRFG